VNSAGGVGEGERAQCL